MGKDKDKKIKELENKVKQLKELAYKDELTGLYNRRGFKEESEKFLHEASVYRDQPERRDSVLIKTFSLVIFDIDDFKKINDTYGHDAGDRALKRLGGIMNERVRDIDLVSRWGGEEIVLGLVGASESEAFEVANDIREKIEEASIKTDGEKFNFTVSGGVASLRDADSFEELFKAADEALYKAKETGKNKIVKYSEL